MEGVAFAVKLYLKMIFGYFEKNDFNFQCRQPSDVQLRALDYIRLLVITKQNSIFQEGMADPKIATRLLGF